MATRIKYVCDGWHCFIRSDRDCWTRDAKAARRFASMADAAQYLVSNGYNLPPIQVVFESTEG
jgi:hypothetical protein